MLNKILLSLALISFIAALIYAPKLLRVYKMINLYEQDKIAFIFINMDKVFQIIIKSAIFEFLYKPNTSIKIIINEYLNCLLYTSDAADE